MNNLNVKQTGHQARKRFGQHFLIDTGIIADIIQAIDPRPEQSVVEIGPGLGALTASLLERCTHMQVIELDRDLVKRLHKQFGASLTIHSGDALSFDFAQCVQENQPLRIVGNLPYNISSPLLFHLLDVAHCVQDQHFMLQKEVVERMVAQPGSAAYSRLSVMLQWRYHMESLLDVPPHAFSPAPKVDSAVVRMIPWPISRMQALRCDTQKFSEIVALAFSQRRKMLRNTFASLQEKIDFSALQFDLTRRAQDVSVEEYVALACAFQERA